MRGREREGHTAPFSQLRGARSRVEVHGRFSVLTTAGGSTRGVSRPSSPSPLCRRSPGAAHELSLTLPPAHARSCSTSRWPRSRCVPVSVRTELASRLTRSCRPTSPARRLHEVRQRPSSSPSCTFPSSLGRARRRRRLGARRGQQGSESASGPGCRSRAVLPRSRTVADLLHLAPQRLTRPPR